MQHKHSDFTSLEGAVQKISTNVPELWRLLADNILIAHIFTTLNICEGYESCFLDSDTGEEIECIDPVEKEGRDISDFFPIKASGLSLLNT